MITGLSVYICEIKPGFFGIVDQYGKEELLGLAGYSYGEEERLKPTGYWRCGFRGTRRPFVLVVSHFSTFSVLYFSLT